MSARDRILLAHGGGGQLTHELIQDEIRPRLQNVWLDAFDDSALLDVPAGRIAFTTDSYVVQPLVFPGGDIGRLAVCGTVNDLAVCGAVPRWISLGLILEEGLPLAMLRHVLDSIAQAATEAEVHVVTGDTKVVARGQCDGLYINTAGVGLVRADVQLGAARLEPGDAILVSGTIADHGMAVMLQRESASVIASALASDVAPLAGLIGRLLDAVPDCVFLRDATRSGLTGVLCELAESRGLHIDVDEEEIPIQDSTRHAAEMLGIDPLDVANEAKVVVVVRERDRERALAALREHPLGRQANVIGRVTETRDGLATLHTDVGGRRVLQKSYGEDLPRIC